MAADDRKGGGPKNVDDLKARLGLKVSKRPPPAAQAAPEPAPDLADGEKTPPPGPAPTPSPAARASAAEPAAHEAYEAPTPRAAAPAYEPPAPEPRPAYTPAAPLYVEEPAPAPKSAWQRYGKPAAVALGIAVAGGLVGYLFGKGAALKSSYGKVKEDAIKISGLLKDAYAKIDEAAGAVDPIYGAAKKAGKDPGNVRPTLRREVDWTSLDALGAFEGPKELESIFETDYKRFNRLTVKYLTSFYVDMNRLTQAARDQAQLTKAARGQLESEAKEGAGPRAFAVVTQGDAGLQRGEVVLLRRRHTVKRDGNDVVVYDVARRTAPTALLQIAEANAVPLSAPGLLKTSGSLLEEYNRRNRELIEILRRLIELRPRITSSVDQIVAQIK